jgi:hypothetical protein
VVIDEERPVRCLARIGGALHSAFPAPGGVDAGNRSQVRRLNRRDARRPRCLYAQSDESLHDRTAACTWRNPGRYQDQGIATPWAEGVASFRTPHLQTISRRRHLVELQRGLQRPSICCPDSLHPELQQLLNSSDLLSAIGYSRSVSGPFSIWVVPRARRHRFAGYIGMATFSRRFLLEKRLVICRRLRVGIANAYIAGPTNITTKIREPLIRESLANAIVNEILGRPKEKVDEVFEEGASRITDNKYMPIPDNTGKSRAKRQEKDHVPNNPDFAKSSSATSQTGSATIQKVRNAILTGCCIGFFYTLFRNLNLSSAPIFWSLVVAGSVVFAFAILRRSPK